MVVGSTLRSMNSLAFGSLLVSSIRHAFPSVEQVVHPIRKLWVTSKLCVHPLGYDVILDIAVVHRHQSWVELLVASFHWKFVWWCLVSQGQLFRLVTSSELLNPLSEVYDVFSNRELLSTPCQQPSDIAVACNVCEDF